MSDRLTHNGLHINAALPSMPTQGPVLFIHGLTAGAWVFEAWLHYFADRGTPAYALDLRGHNGSRPVPDYGRTSLRDYATDVADAAAFIASRHDGAVPALLGHSMGGLIAQIAAERGVGSALVMMSSAPPRGIILFNPSLVFQQLKYLPALFGSRPFLVAEEEQMEITFNVTPREDALRFVKRLVPESGRAAKEITFGLIAVDAAKIRVPRLSTGGVQDAFVPASIARKLATKYGCECRLYDAHGHNMMGEPGWERPASELLEWVATQVPIARAAVSPV
jgi:pimeloyl-ACP methyl ester carboxylesterase